MDVKKTMRELWYNKKNLQNLSICSFLWFATILQFQITLNYQYATPLAYFDDTYVHSIVELAGYIFSLVVYLKLKKKGRIFMIANLFSILGSIALIITDSTNKLPYLNTISLFVSKFGATMAYQGVFLIVEIYPLIFYSTVFGICNLFGVISNILAIEYINNLPNDIVNLIIYIIIAVISFVVSYFIIEEEQDKSIEKKRTYSDIEDSKLIY